MDLLVASLLATMAIYVLLGEVARARWRAETAEEFYLAGRSLGWAAQFLTYFSTTYSAFMLVGLVGYARLYGVGSLGFELTYLVGTAAVLALLSDRIRRRALELGAVTPAQLIYSNNGSVIARYVVSLSYLIFLVPYMSVQVVGPAVVMARLGVSYELAVVLTLSTVVIYVVRGGMRGVVLTDALQGLYFLAVAAALVIYVGRGLGEVPRELHEVPGGLNFWTPERFISLTVPWIFFALTNPQALQRLYTPKSSIDLFRGGIAFLTAGSALTICVVLVGLGAAGLGVEASHPNLVTPALLAGAPAALSVAAALAVWAAAVSTLDSIMLTLASVIDVDVLGRGDAKVGRAAVAGLALVVGLFSLKTSAPIVTLAVASSAALLYLAPIVILSVTRGLRRSEEASALVLLGFATFAALYVIRSRFLPSALDYASLGSLASTSLAGLALALRDSLRAGERR